MMSEDTGNGADLDDAADSTADGAEDSGRDPQERYARAFELIEQGREAIAEGHGLLRGLSGDIRHARARGAIHQAIWDCERMANRRAHFFSASGQDAFLDDRVFKGKREGVFVEIGGYDGLTASNTLYFELMRGWSGLVIEASPHWHEKAAEFRRCACLNYAVSGVDGKAPFMEVQEGLTQMSGLLSTYPPEVRSLVEADERHLADEIEVRTRRLERILDSQFLDRIDYVSLDVEGAELSILRSFPFEKYRIRAWTIEGTGRDAEAITQLMRAKGYRRVEALGTDDVWLRDAD